MKVLLVSAFLVFFASCATRGVVTPSIDLIDKGIIRADLHIVDDETRQSLVPRKVYFAKLSSMDDYKSDKIIVTDKVDSDGMIYINLQPGLYAVVATERVMDTRYSANSFVYTFFDNDMIKRTAINVEKGSTSIIRLRVFDYKCSLWDKVPDSAKYYKMAIYKQWSDFCFPMIGRFLDSPESKKKAEEVKKKAEEVHSTIETY